MLILEGSDCLGKTTAAKRLVELAAEDRSAQYMFPVSYSHMSRPNQHFDFHSHYLDMISRFAVQDRFHLGSLVWHSGVMDEAKLRVIEGWLLSVGSMICVIATDDETWYGDHLDNSEKSEMFETDSILQANRRYLSMVGVGEEKLEAIPHVDESYIVNGKNGFVSDVVLKTWMRKWYRRLSYVAYDNSGCFEVPVPSVYGNRGDSYTISHLQAEGSRLSDVSFV